MKIKKDLVIKTFFVSLLLFIALTFKINSTSSIQNADAATNPKISSCWFLKSKIQDADKSKERPINITGVPFKCNTSAGLLEITSVSVEALPDGSFRYTLSGSMVFKRQLKGVVLSLQPVRDNYFEAHPWLPHPYVQSYNDRFFTKKIVVPSEKVPFIIRLVTKPIWSKQRNCLLELVVARIFIVSEESPQGEIQIDLGQFRAGSCASTPTATPTLTPTITPTRAPSPTPYPTIVPGTAITFINNQPFPVTPEFKDVNHGYKSITVNVTSSGTIQNWSPLVSFDGGLTYFEQHRFNCVNNICPQVTIPVLFNGAKAYAIGIGAASGTINATGFLNEEPTAEVILLGQDISFPLTSDSFKTDDFTNVTITADAKTNPHLTAISLQNFETDWVEKARLNCDGVAACTLQTLPVLGGEYRVVVEGTGSGGIVGLILRP